MGITISLLFLLAYTQTLIIANMESGHLRKLSQQSACHGSSEEDRILCDHRMVKPGGVLLVYNSGAKRTTYVQ